MPHQYRHLIEGNVEAKPLQAERDQVLNIREHAAPALNMKHERAALAEESRGPQPCEEFDEPGLPDAGRAVDHRYSH